MTRSSWGKVTRRLTTIGVARKVALMVFIMSEKKTP